MICQELDQFLHPYLDGEFDAVERREVEAHLAGCAHCAQRLAHEGQLQARLRERLRQVALTHRPGLKEAVLLNVRAEQRRARVAAWARWGAAAVLAAAAGVALVHFRPRERERFMEAAALRHARSLPYEVQAANPAQLEAWFNGKLDYRVPVPRLAHATVAGARLSHVKDREAAYIGYQASLPSAEAPRRVGLFVFDDADDELAAAPWPDVEVQEVRGYRVAAWRSGGMVYELVSDLDEDGLRTLLAPEPAAALPALAPPPGPPELKLIPASLRH